MNICTRIVVPNLDNSCMLILFVVFILGADKKMEGSSVYKSRNSFHTFLEAFLSFN